MATIWEETKTQGSKLKGKPFKEKLLYFWEYYKIHTLIVILAVVIIGSIIKTVVTAKDYALSVVLINPISPTFNESYSDWTDDLTKLLDFDPKKYEVYIDGSMTIGQDNTSANAEYASLQKFAALMTSASIDIIIANTDQFERYAQMEYYQNLKDFLPADLYNEFESAGMIYYTDAATFSDYEKEAFDVFELQASYTVNHTDPSSMTSPIPVGIIVSDEGKVAEKQLYLYLVGADNFQGYPPQAVLAVTANTPRPENTIEAVKYFTGR